MHFCFLPWNENAFLGMTSGINIVGSVRRPWLLELTTQLPTL